MVIDEDMHERRTHRALRASAAPIAPDSDELRQAILRVADASPAAWTPALIRDELAFEGVDVPEGVIVGALQGL